MYRTHTIFIETAHIHIFRKHPRKLEIRSDGAISDGASDRPSYKNFCRNLQRSFKQGATSVPNASDILSIIITYFSQFSTVARTDIAGRARHCSVSLKRSGLCPRGAPQSVPAANESIEAAGMRVTEARKAGWQNGVIRMTTLCSAKIRPCTSFAISVPLKNKKAAPPLCRTPRKYFRAG